MRYVNVFGKVDPGFCFFVPEQLTSSLVLELGEKVI